MKIYLVGGAVRDKLLNIEVKEKDWVVVGASRQTMLDLNYKQVGKDFPVFLHPKTHEEYALARTERKTAAGYHGFDFVAGKEVTLEQDLLRRDLTINAIAEDDNGKIIDPYNGCIDINNKVLRHISTAFLEDPVRVLRTARFAARFAHLGFTVATETISLMKTMVDSGEVNALVAERVWQELTKALSEKTPSIFFKVLRECGALAVIFPEINNLFGVPQPEKWHPEIDTGIHTMMVLDQATALSNAPEVRFAVLTHDLGKATTPIHILPSHYGHEERGAKLTKSLCKRLKAPKKYRDLAIMTAKYHTICHIIRELKPGTIIKKLAAMDAYRKPQRFEQFLIACEADSKGRTGHENSPYPQANYFRAMLKAANSVNIAELVKKGETGKQMAAAINKSRTNAIKLAIQNYNF